MNLFGIMDVSGSGLKAERVRAEVVASNMANSETTQTAEGGPYRRHHVVFSAEGGGSFQQSMNGQMSLVANNMDNPLIGHWGAGLGGYSTDARTVPGGVAVSGVIEDASEPLRRYDPQHPDAGADGYVAYPDINPLTEMVDLMGANRAYGLNASAVQAEKNMLSSSLEILK
ncbi:flagellar basal body rod protein FlgC [Granulicella sp. dw_53]|uniref:flagellar basal body rod protein FlgC n=1 Tax=Granulicella sp. dw_53 TaxID=2719792 RepID=UPI001BD1DD4C|nr:flagellar basal body rod protein FlgC [Granulicella sp. dw_53]